MSQSKKLSGKVAVVTGASKGIGAGIAKTLALSGAAVVVNYSSSKEGADKVVAEILKADGKAIAVQGDMSKAEDVVRLFAETKKTFGSLDILVNNAGVYGFSLIDDISEKEYRRQFDTNVLGPILATQQAVKFFGERGGSVINVSSAITRAPMAGSTIYAATKGALDVLTRALSKELGSKKIRVNAVNPGPVATEGTAAAGIDGSAMIAKFVEETPLGRVGLPDDIARVALFLASDDSQWMTGEVLVAAGGL